MKLSSRKMEYFLLALILAFAAVASENINGEIPTIRAPIGNIRGSLMTSRLGKKFFAFRGVRYAEPPTGENRFKPPIPANPWNDTFDASEEGPSCPRELGELVSEDCLRLNVYTTQPLINNSCTDQAVTKPVIVFFHPGGFYGYSAQSYIFGPQYLLDQEIVLVMVNYRIGALGFLSTGDSLAPGNLGLKDQVVALQWVQKNIAAFGGDPESVTLTGYSAGSWSVALHMVSPMSKGLFHRVISMSGSPLLRENLPINQTNLVKKQAELLGCPSDTTANILACLRTKPTENFTDTLSQFYEWRDNPILIWSPVVEPEVSDTERFLTTQPIESFRQGNFRQVPFITGVAKDEFGGSIVEMIEEYKAGDDSAFRELNADWETIAPIIYYLDRNSSRSKQIVNHMRQFYFGDKPIGIETTENLADALADNMIFNEHRLSHLVARNSKGPVYYYKFVYQGRYSHVTWSDTKKPYGVVHHDDLMYLFYISYLTPLFGVEDPEAITIDRLTAIWSNFAKTGEPIPKNSDLFQNVSWEKLTRDNERYLEIGSNIAMKTGLYLGRMREWEKFFPF